MEEKMLKGRFQKCSNYIASLCIVSFLFSCAVPTESDNEVAKYTAIIEKDPNNAEAYHNRGKVYFDKREYGKAISDYDKALEINSGMLEALYDRACAYIEKEEWDKGLSDLDSYISDPVNERSFKAFERRGYTYLRKGDYDRALSDANRAIQLNPGYFPAITTKGKAQKAKANQ
jgi:tetratricopeptide (TPR) repeat protein